MGLRLILAPAIEPVTLIAAKEHLRANDDEDGLIQTLIYAAREYAQGYTGRALITQTWEFTASGFPSYYESYFYGTLKLPLGKLQSVTSVSYVNEAGATQTLAASDYQVDTSNDSAGRITPAFGKYWPTTRAGVLEAVTVRFIAGYGLAAAVPFSIKAAMLLIIGHLFANREATGPDNLQNLPMGVEALLAPYVLHRIPVSDEFF